MKYDFGNVYAYFSDIDDQILEPLLDELDTYVFVDANYGHGNVTGISIYGFFSGRINTHNMFIKTPDCSTNLKFGANFTVLKKTVEESVILWCHLISMGIKVSKPTPVLVENMSVVLNATDPGSTLNKKTVVLSYYFFM